MKVCSLYGAGYYYMPGSDICLKLGGYVRYQYTVNPGTTISAGPQNGEGGRNTRTNEVDGAHRTRAVATIDTRQQTAYGTLRTYTLLGYQQDTTILGTTAAPVYMTRGFIQIAGFTFGKATSFFDIMPGASFAYNAGAFFHPDTGDAGQMLAAYTAQFGNGFSATISAEQSRRGSTWNTAITAAPLPGANPTSTGLGTAGGVNVGHYSTDIVANLRIDQAWGSALIAGALHDASGGYYTALETSGHPSNKTGWAITAGFILNLPMIARGDRLSAGVVYAEGATRYAAITPSGAGLNQYQGNNVGFGIWTDSVYGAAGGLGHDVQLTTAWSTSAAFEHFWTPALRTSLYGSYVSISYNSNAKSLICTAYGVGATGCDPNWSAWNLGSRTQWEPLRGLIMGVDILYQKINSITTSTGTLTLAANGAKPAGVYTLSDQSAWVGSFRIQRDFLP